jgi:hypothetical protein
MHDDSDIGTRWFTLGVVATTAILGAFLAVYLHRWPTHEDETLALFVGRGSLPHVLHTVIAERGGAPLHFLFAWAVVHLGGGLSALRAVSLAFAVASVPAIAALGARLVDRLTGLVAAVLAAATWVMFFHGIFGRMYSLFLFTSALSFIALLDALDHGGRRRFGLWALALIATLASHPYAVFVVGAQALYVVLRGDRRRAALTTLAAVCVAAVPFWWADVVLRNRFGVGVGGGGVRLGSPRRVADYLWWTAGDFSVGHHFWGVVVLALAAAGLVLMVRRSRSAALLVGCVVAVPTLALLAARLRETASPETRHLIFALPFYSTLVATALVALARRRPHVTAPLAAAAVAALVTGEVAWAHHKTPVLFDGAPRVVTQARADASRWLASTGRHDDVLLGYEPVYLGAWEHNHSFSDNALPRADPALFASALRSLREPLGRGVWIFDASDTTNVQARESIPLRVPWPRRAFVGRVFGPLLVIRSRKPLLTPPRYLRVSERVMRLGRRLEIGDADINLHAMLLAQKRIYDSPPASSSRSTISR